MTESNRVLALGFFDGVHMGHKALLDIVNNRASQYSLIPSVLNFDIHPDNLLHSCSTPLLYSDEKRRDILLHEFRISDIILLHFDVGMMKTEWDRFLDYLIEKYHVRWLVAGYDFRFGYRGEGSAEKLKEYCLEKEIGCDIVPAVILDGEAVRSSRIRTCIHDGNIDLANRLLGRPYSMEGIVRKGQHIGTRIGFPTVNLLIPERQIIPRFGVYATNTILNGKALPSITNIGIRPTFSSSEQVTVETYILNYHQALYDSEIEIVFYGFIRDEIRFSNASELSAQIRKDISQANVILTEE